jgi:hypothetical protein
MNKKNLLYVGLAALLLISGIVVYKTVSAPKAPAVIEEEEVEVLPEVDASIVVSVTKSRAKANTIVLAVSGLGAKYQSVAYEITYESQGLIKGLNSGSKPVEVAGEDGFEREIYLGTCSRNVCKPDAGVTAVSVVLEFTDTAGKRSQFSKEYEL